MTKRLVSFIVEVGEDWDYDDVRRQVGDGTAELYNDQPVDWEKESDDEPRA